MATTPGTPGTSAASRSTWSARENSRMRSSRFLWFRGSIRRSVRELNASSKRRGWPPTPGRTLLCALRRSADRTAFLRRHLAIVDALIVRGLVAQPFLSGGGGGRHRPLKLRTAGQRERHRDCERGQYGLHRAPPCPDTHGIGLAFYPARAGRPPGFGSVAACRSPKLHSDSESE